MSTTRSLLEIATGVGERRAGRGAASNTRAGASFEDVIETVLAPHGQLVRGHPATKVVRTKAGPKTIYTAKNGVDFVGVCWGRPVALEAKSLVGAASLRGGKDDSTRAEAAWLLRFVEQGGIGAFVVHDPESARVYVVAHAPQLASLAVGGVVPLRTRDGQAVVTAHAVEVAGRFDLADAVRRAVGGLVQGSAGR